MGEIPQGNIERIPWLSKKGAVALLTYVSSATHLFYCLNCG